MPAIDPEQALIATIWVVYLLGCLHWLSPGQVAYVCDRKGSWSAKRIDAKSYTLLGRMPLVRNPFSTKAGLVLLTEPIGAGVHERLFRMNGPALSAATRGLRNRTKMLSLVARISAVYLLAILPGFVAMGLLELLWRQLLIMLLAVHLAVIAEFWACTRLWRRVDGTSYTQTLISVCLNPLAGIRSADSISNWWFVRRSGCPR
jgi:hypothetical protein